MIACEGLFSKEAYIGNWCDVLRCKEPKDNMCRVIISVIFKIILILMLIVSLGLSAVQIINLVSDPILKSFPVNCPSDPKIACGRYTNDARTLP